MKHATFLRKAAVAAALSVSVFALASSLQAADRPYDEAKTLAALKILSADDMQGRRTGTEGSAKARDFLIAELKALGLKPVAEAYGQSFVFTVKRRNGDEQAMSGTNVIAMIKGTASDAEGAPALVLSAHYDHLGVRGEQIFNGTDDNASGVAALLAMADSFMKNPPKNDIIFAFFDAEEMGLQGAKSFVASPSIGAGCIGFNLNMDMLSRNDKNELYVAGTYHTPALNALVDIVASNASIKLLKGHDKPEDGHNDWTLQSDHGPFHKAGIPFVYFGVEDHAHYHKATDVYESVPLDFYIKAVDTVEATARQLDADFAKYAKTCG